MPSKSKGTNAERELIHLFWATSTWAACRIAGSGSSQYPSADVLASNTKRKLAIEAKLTKNDSKYFLMQEIKKFEEFSLKFGAEPWLAIKFKKKGWLFFRTNELIKTKGNFKISLKEKGLTFKELVNLI